LVGTAKIILCLPIVPASVMVLRMADASTPLEIRQWYSKLGKKGAKSRWAAMNPQERKDATKAAREKLAKVRREEAK
jgi:hypothetical protein